ncbi:branched-chain amino acid transport system II carrier protein [Vescimonas sp.]|uniref:branched-chain amino acid transport system II carrier protein n=1 Tax=Vescimonas sp. TaxID=2892404 RepID=UPI003076E8C0
MLVSPNIYKNGVSVGIPGTNRIGLELAAALGALLDEPERGLAILADVTGDIVQQAAAIVSDGRVHVAYGQTPEPLYVRAIVSGGGEEAQAVIRGDYSCVTEILRNGAPVMQAEGRTHGTAVYPLVEYSVQELYETILSIERESFRFLLEDARRNQEAVRRDLEDPELPLGRLLKQRISGQMTGPLAVSAEAQAYTAAAAGEARMSDLSVPQTTLLSGLVGRVLGGFGKVCMGLAVSLTCLTTAIGIGSTGASVINEVSKGRISYKLWMGIACVVGAVFGSFGIQNIINYVTPIFLIMYPICIVLTVLGLVDKWIPNDGVYKFGVAVAGIVSVGDAILAVAPNLDGLRKVMYMIPLAEQGFSWLIPTVIAMVIGGIVYRGKPRYNYGETAVATEEAAK